MIKAFGLLLSTLSLMASAETNNKGNDTNTPDISFPISQQRLFDQDLTKYSDTNEVAWLGDKDSRFLTLWREQTTGNVVGTSWLFGNTYTSANSPGIIQTLRNQLSHKGLHSYSISPLSQALNSERSEERLLGQLQVLQEKIVNQKGKRLLILQGANSQAIINILIKNPDIYVDAIVLISTNSPTTALSTQLSQQLLELKTPILDLYTQTDELAVIEQAKIRLTAAKRVSRNNYRQVEVIGLPVHMETQITTSQIIYGWLVTQGWY
ncbi:DUF3530 family protein [Moritella marina]|uniref:DUF3530 family protein n=1 Tax=Moritella marina TaxID=90736 RepID=UPI0037041958